MTDTPIYTSLYPNRNRVRTKFLSPLIGSYEISKEEWEKIFVRWEALSLPLTDLGGGETDLSVDDAFENLEQVGKLKLGKPLTEKFKSLVTRTYEASSSY